MADDRDKLVLEAHLDSYALCSMVDRVVTTEVRFRWVDLSNADRK